MIKMKQRIVALLLALCLFTGLIPAVSAADTVASGTCGTNLTWVLTDDGTLTISGKGEMEDYYPNATIENAPWHEYCYDIKSVEIKNGVTSIGNYAFELCSKMMRVSLPNTLTSIGTEAFYRCTSLESITLPESLKELGFGALSGCDGLTSVTIPSQIKVIEDELFFGCDNLTSVKLPEGLKSIGYYSFGLSGLTNINIPSTVTYLDGRAFHCTPWEENLDGGYIIVGDHVLIGYYDDETPLYGTAVIPEGVKYIAPSAFGFDEMEEEFFGDCRGITSVVLPQSLLEIGYWAFNYQEFESISIPANVRFIDRGAFIECFNLNTIYFEGNAPVMDENLFSDAVITAYYPSNNSTWTADVLADYDGDVTWIGYHSFGDTPSNSFYFEPVVWASTSGITTGATATTFNPGGECLRAQVVTFLHRAAKSPEPTSSKNPFSDVKSSDFFYKPVLWAVEKNITNGVSGTKFGSYDVCNRAAVVTFLWRAAGQPEPKTTKNPFTDVDPSDFFYKPVLWAVENGITNGVDATHFGPTSPCNRAQVVTFLYRTYN